MKFDFKRRDFQMDLIENNIKKEVEKIFETELNKAIKDNNTEMITVMRRALHYSSLPYLQKPSGF